MTLPLTTPTRGDAAVAYARRGWPVLPLHWWQDGCCSCGDPECRTPAKHPLSPIVSNGVHGASAIVDVVTAWWRREPRANVGIRTGPESGLVVIDIDVREHVDGRATLAALVESLGPLPETVEAVTGSGSRHLLFQWPGHDVVGKLGPGVDVKARGGYIVAAPSSHASGRSYDWEASGHPDDVPVAALPEAWRTRLRFAAPTEPALPVETRALSEFEVQKIRGALGVLVPGEYDDWIGAGMALHHETGGSAQAFSLWWEWSASWIEENPASEKVSLPAVRRHWKSFVRTDGPRRTFGWLYHRAAECGWVAPRPPVVFDPTPITTPPTTFDESLAHGAPGVLKDIVRWSLAHATQPVPLFSLAAALAVGAVVAGRRFTLGGTSSHLYLLVAGRTAAGKDHIKQTITACVPATLLGPGDFASDSAILSTLRDRPQLVCVLDEFGQQLAATRGQGSYHRASAIRMLMEAWSARMLLGKALSTLSLSPGEAPPPVQIQRPSLTLTALTTPERLHEALEAAHVGDGFLNRWLLLEHDAERTVPDPQGHELIPPPAVTAWVAAMLGGEFQASAIAPTPHDVPRSDEATEALRQVAIDATANANALDRVSPGAGGLWGRAAEQVRRLTLIAALADASAPGEAVADVQHVEWARAIVWWSQGLLVKTATERIGDTPFERARSKALAAIEAAGAAGTSRRDLMRSALQRQTPRDVDAVLEALVQAGLITEQPGPRGAARYYYGEPAG